MIELLGLIAGIIAVVSVYLNNLKLRACFYGFLLSNGLSLWIHIHAGLWQNADVKSMILRDVAFIGLAIHGLRKWKRMEATH